MGAYEPTGWGDCCLTPQFPKRGRKQAASLLRWVHALAENPRPLKLEPRYAVCCLPRSFPPNDNLAWERSPKPSPCVHTRTLAHFTPPSCFCCCLVCSRVSLSRSASLVFSAGSEEMAKAWLVNSRLIAKKVKNATFYSTCPVKDWSAEAIRECPNCKHRIDNSDVSLKWPGLPAGVKFDPSDIELVEHLAGKVGNGDSKPHVFIDEFIATLDEDEGICYTHPENLPGIKKDGSSVHFFHRTFKAYATGHRKRRKVGNGCTSSEDHVRWHKTGKTRPVMKNGVQRGFKKIMVLYKSSQKGMKPVKANWVVHQYHLGAEEDEKEGEFVVSKVFFQSQGNQVENGDMDTTDVDSEVLVTGVCPRTPKTHTPCPPRAEKICPHDDGDEETTTFFSRDKEIKGPQENLSNAEIGNGSAVWAGKSQVAEDKDYENPFISLTCDEVLDPLFPLEEMELKHHSRKDFSRNNDTLAMDNESHDFTDLDSIDVDTPPDFDLADLQFGSQDSLMSWLDWL